MLKKTVSTLLIFSLVYVGTVITALAGSTTEKDAARAAKVKAAVAKLGVGTDTRVSLKLKDKTKLAGYIAEAGEDSFVVADLKTGEATTVVYPSVTQIKGQNLSTGAKIAIGAAIGIGVLVLILILIRLDNEGAFS